MDLTSRTYNAQQLAERAKELFMETSGQLLAAVRSNGFNPERVEALSSAVVASAQALDVIPEGDPEAE